MRTASGDLRATSVDGDLDVHSASGAVDLGEVTGVAAVRTASGEVRLGAAGGDVQVATASGDITVGRVSAGDIQLRTASGDVTVGVAPGRRLWLDLQTVTGRLDSSLESDGRDAAGDRPGADDPPALRVRLQSVSGDLQLHRAG